MGGRGAGPGGVSLQIRAAVVALAVVEVRGVTLVFFHCCDEKG
jgi:hypothetical protein